MKPEDRLQRAVHRWWKRHQPPGWTMEAIEHGIAYAGDETSRAKQWGRMAAKGVKSGIEDLQFTGPLKTLIAVELKWGKNGQQETQIKRQQHLIACGHRYHVCRSVSQVAEVLTAAVPLNQWAFADAEAYDRQILEANEAEKQDKPRVRVAKRPHVKKAHDRTQARLAVLERARSKGVVI